MQIGVEAERAVHSHMERARERVLAAGDVVRI